MSSNKEVRVGCGALIINENNEALLLKRGSKTRNQAGMWSKPGGGVEFGESVEDAIKREILEELGIELELVCYLSYTEQIFKAEDQHWVAISYLAKIKNGGKPRNLEPHKHEEIAWFALDNLPQNLSSTTIDSTKAYKELLVSSKNLV